MAAAEPRLVQLRLEQERAGGDHRLALADAARNLEPLAGGAAELDVALLEGVVAALHEQQRGVAVALHGRLRHEQPLRVSPVVPASVTRANIPGLSSPRSLGSATRTRMVRVRGSTTAPMLVTLPL